MARNRLEMEATAKAHTRISLLIVSWAITWYAEIGRV